MTVFLGDDKVRGLLGPPWHSSSSEPSSQSVCWSQNLLALTHWPLRHERSLGKQLAYTFDTTGLRFNTTAAFWRESAAASILSSSYESKVFSLDSARLRSFSDTGLSKWPITVSRTLSRWPLGKTHSYSPLSSLLRFSRKSLPAKVRACALSFFKNNVSKVKAGV